MRKIVIALAALAAFGIAVPAATTSAEARDVVVIKKKHRDHGRHLGWYRGHHYGWYKHRKPGAKVIIRRD
jgi:Ni/Co efflux regulator RcnB